MIGAVLAEINEAWQNMRYFDMTEFKEWSTKRRIENEKTKVINI